MEPTFDADGYPTVETLETIANWEIKSNADIRALYSYCRSAWRWPNMFGCPTIEFYGASNWISCATGGWSGNESIISALERNLVFWGLCWLRSERGGSYRFLTNPIREAK